MCCDNTGRHELINKLSECITLERFSTDPRRVDTHGRCLLELCKATGLLILNGRIGHDEGIGACTRINETSATMVDYVIASPGLFPSVNGFKMNRKFPESDHLPISFSMESNKPVELIDNKDMSGWKPHIKYMWSECDLNDLGTALRDEHSDKYRDRLKVSLAELRDTNTVALAANELISQADKCRQYRACKQMKKRRFRNERLGAIEDACHGNSPKFWKIIDKICPNLYQRMNPRGRNLLNTFRSCLYLKVVIILMILWKIMRSVSCKECPKIINIILIVILKTI